MKEQMEGAFEEKLLDIVRKEKHLEEVLIQETDSRLLYYLSPIRQNVLRWFDFDKEASLLEIGAEYGAITGLFCENVKQVVAIESSEKSAFINKTRNDKFSNLEVCVGEFSNIKLEQKFDYITVIGSLEFPYLDMLKKAKSMLNPGGKLLLAIENKYGMKYWAGAPDDHTGKLFDSIQGYDAQDRAHTLSKGRLKVLLKEAGFEQQAFYYPVPDYKMPMEIYSEKQLPKPGDIRNISPAYDKARYEMFDERLAYSSVCEDGLFEEFANAFIVVCE